MDSMGSSVASSLAGGYVLWTVWILAGGVAGAITLVLLRSEEPHVERIRWAGGLVVAALIYVAFAVVRGAPLPWWLVEAGGLGLYGGLALVGARTVPWMVAAGWALHSLWDVGLHGGTVTPFVPAWYPPLCLGFDLLVAGYLFSKLRRR